MIEVVRVETRRQKKQFRNLTDKLYQHDPFYVPIIKLDMMGYMKRTHPFYKKGDAQFFLAYQDGQPVGRICAYTNKNYQAYHKKDVGFFGSFESIDDQAVANALFDAAKAWLKERGLTVMRGSRDYYSDEPCGILVDGFEGLPPIPLLNHQPYYKSLFEGYGFQKHGDYCAYEIKNFPQVMAENMKRSEKILERMIKRSGITLRPFDKRNLESETKKAVELFNIFEQVNGENFIPIAEEDAEYFIKALKPILIPEFIVFAEKDGETIGMIAAIPDVSELLAQVKHGKLFPTGIFKLLRIKSYPYKRLRIMLLGLKDEYKKSGLGPALTDGVLRNAIKMGYQDLDMSLVDEHNPFMKNVAENMGGKVHKTYRVYQLEI